MIEGSGLLAEHPNNSMKNTIRNLITTLNSKESVRRIFTRNFTSDCVGLGERRSYFSLGFWWLMVDLQDADVNVDLSIGRLPFADDSKSKISAMHFFEHISQDSALVLFKDCCRILKNGGTLAIDVPDVKKIVELYKGGNVEKITALAPGGVANNLEELHKYAAGAISCYVENGEHKVPDFEKIEFDDVIANGDLDSIGRWCQGHLTDKQKESFGHQNFFYFDKLRVMLEAVGFKQVKLVQKPGLKDRLKNPFYRKGRDFYSIYVVATK
jgi:SAM-dependent methyltransferase